MKIIQSMNLRQFDFYGFARVNARTFTYDELKIIQRHLEDLYPDGIKADLLNDMFWLEPEILASWVFGWEGSEDELSDLWDTFQTNRLKERSITL